MMKIIIIAIFLAGFQTSFAFEKVGTTSFQFLKVMTDARSTAMGEAYVALASGADAVFWNPAALTRTKKFDAQISYLDYFLDVRHSSFALSYNLGNWGSIGLQGMLADVGDIEVTRVDHLGFIGEVYNPGLTGEIISPSSMVFGLSYAREMTDRFAFGITAKYVKEDLVVESADAIVFDGGLTYNTNFKSIVVAASVRHFGSEIKYLKEGYPLPQTFNIGISGYLFSPGNSLLGNMGENRFLVAFDLVQPRDYDQQYNAGLEYSFKNMLFLRAGYKFNYDEESYSAGFGLLFKNYQIDYSYNDFGQYLDSLHRFTFGFSLR